mmetsp:Transcript_13290/g.39623  ORF Transcript_13290/g.39623 Transcript_13290/m.39623 type:complete len:247 (+) Transcript_13290:477-1217(+)
MSNLVGHDVDLRPVLGQQRRRHECQARILHAAVRKAGWQHQEVVNPPPVRAAQFLPCFHEFLCVRKLPRALLDHVFLAPNVRPRSHSTILERPAHNRHQICRDRYLLLETMLGPGLPATCGCLPVGLLAGLGRSSAHGRHQRGELRWAPDDRAVRGLALARVLARQHRPGVDGLALRKHVRETLPRGLGGRQPLQCRAAAFAMVVGRRRLVTHPGDQLVPGLASGQRDPDGKSEHRVLFRLVAAPG